jgi:hypothetical protein
MMVPPPALTRFLLVTSSNGMRLQRPDVASHDDRAIAGGPMLTAAPVTFP